MEPRNTAEYYANRFAQSRELDAARLERIGEWTYARQVRDEAAEAREDARRFREMGK
jgi:hypothetical protein